MTRRHDGVIAFAIFGIVFGLIGLAVNTRTLLAVLHFKANPSALGESGQHVLNEFGIVAMSSIATNVVTGVLLIVAGIALFIGAGWGRTLYVTAAIITIVNRGLTFPLHFLDVGTATETVQQFGAHVGSVIGDLCVIAFNIAAI